VKPPGNGGLFVGGEQAGGGRGVGGRKYLEFPAGGDQREKLIWGTVTARPLNFSRINIVLPLYLVKLSGREAP